MIIYTGAFRFPNKDAAATRVKLIAKTLSEAGETIKFISWGRGGRGVENGFDYLCSSDLDNADRNAFIRALNFLFLGWRALLLILKERSSLRGSIIILYNPGSFFSIAILILSKLYGFKVVLDSTEWYDSGHLRGGKYGLLAIENNFRMRVVYKLFCNYIVISDYLASYYSSCAKNLICVPALVENICLPSKKTSERLSFIYAGNMGQKDIIIHVARAIKKLNAVGFYVNFDIYGPSEEEVFRSLKEFSSFVNIKGYVGHDEVIEAYKKSDFSVLIRDEKRYAFAGFPTKASESWACGVPLITNAVGDLVKYCNASNSLVIKDVSCIEAVIVDFFLGLKKEDLHEMKLGSIETARSNFLWSSYVDRVSRFVSTVRES